MSSIAWPDVAIGFLVAFGALRGLKRGLVRELTGAVALGFGIAAGFAYAGTWDAAIAHWTHLAPGSAHIVAMLLYAAVAYGVVLVLAGALATAAKLPLIGTANALLGALAGSVKAAVFVWATVYIALFFPLTHDVRGDLRRSYLVAQLQRPNASLDDRLRDALPPFVRPFADGLFSHHRV